MDFHFSVPFTWLFQAILNRMRVKIRRCGLTQGDTSCRGLSFEAENISPKTTSFEPTFQVTGYSERKKKTVVYHFQHGTDRQLPPFVAKSFTAWHTSTENREVIWLWFITITLTLSQGQTVVIRVLNASDWKPMGYASFHWQRLKYYWFGIFPE